MTDHTPDAPIPDDRVPDILARAAEIDRQRRETSSVDDLRAVALDAGISVSSLEAALEEYAKADRRSGKGEERKGKSTTTGTLLSVFLGGFGAHRFYLHDNLGILYLVFVWTMIPSFLGLVEAFFMPDRVRAYNARMELIEAVRAHRLTSGEKGRRPCPHCAELIMPEAKVCRFCGNEVAPQA